MKNKILLLIGLLLILGGLFLTRTKILSSGKVQPGRFPINVEVMPTPFPGSVLYVPRNYPRAQGLIIFHGSEGGRMMFTHVEAMFYASNGFTTMAFCYLDCDGSITNRRQVLKNIPLEKGIEAINWLRHSEWVGKKKIGLYGLSRGAEFASLLTQYSVTDPTYEVDALAAHAGTHQVESPYSWDWKDERCWSQDKVWNPLCGEVPRAYKDYKNTATWTYHKKPIVMWTPIDLKNFKGAMFFTHGKKDDAWEWKRTQKLVSGLSKTQVEVHYYEDEGHIFSFERTNERRKLAIDFFRKNLK